MVSPLAAVSYKYIAPNSTKNKNKQLEIIKRSVRMEQSSLLAIEAGNEDFFGLKKELEDLNSE